MLAEPTQDIVRKFPTVDPPTVGNFWEQFITTCIGRPGQLLATEGIHLEGLQHAVEEDGTHLKGPALWLAQHESWYDLIHLPYLWERIGKPPMRGVSRTNYFPDIPLLSKLVSWLMTSTAFFEVNRVSTFNGISTAERRALQEQNEQTMARIREMYTTGAHIVIAPEGTSKSDGTIAPIKRGAYDLSHIVREGIIEALPCIPIGNTYDFMTGEKRGSRRLLRVFLNVGEPFYVHPSGNSDVDRRYFTAEVRQHFLDLNTITTAQLGAEYVLRFAEERGEELLTFDQLAIAIEKRADALRTVPGLYFDPDLTTGRERRAELLYETLLEKEYLDSWGSVAPETVLHVPQNVADFKRGNILMYTANRLRAVAQGNKDVREALEQTFI